MYMDMGSVFDEIFEAARDFSDEVQRNFKQFEQEGPRSEGCGRDRHCGLFTDEPRVDYYPNYSYPPMNVFMTEDRSMVFEFAMAGFDEKDISLAFQGDYMVFSAKMPVEESASDGTVRYFKRRLKMRDIEKQKYFVPQDKYAQDKVKAVYKNGVLRVAIPPKDEPDQNGGIKVEIIKEGD
jgi:HSP20 family molecular chaperone IbpA